jgi:cytochrome c oxidase subunit III
LSLDAITNEPRPPAEQAAGPGHDGHGLVAHHFENLEQQREAGTLGMWLFLASEVLFFGGIFTAYAMMRSRAAVAVVDGMPQSGFAVASKQLSATLGGINTAVLLTSSLTMALAVWASQTRQRGYLKLFLGLTLFFGAVFLGIKAFEWYQEYEHHLVPGADFHVEEKYRALEKPMELFFVFYFSITGLHALHMIVGLAVLGAQLALVYRRPAFGIADYTPIELSGLYWHFVDVVWIFVFPLLYLLRA